MPPQDKVYNVVDTKGPAAGKVRAVVGEKALATAIGGPGQARIEGESEELSRRAAAGEAARYDNTASHIGGYLERFADSATVGILPVARGLLGNKYDREGMSGRRAATEGTLGTAIDVLGMVAPAVASLGTGTVGSIAAKTPMGALSRVTGSLGRSEAERLVARQVVAGVAKEVAEKEVAAELAKQTAAQAAKRLAIDTVRATTAAAVDGAVASGGAAAAAMGRGDEKVTASGLLYAMWQGAKYGAPFGTVAHLGVAATRRLIKGSSLVRKVAGGDAAAERTFAQLQAEMDQAVADSLSQSAAIRAAAKRAIDQAAIDNPALAMAARQKLAEAQAAAKAAKDTARGDYGRARIPGSTADKAERIARGDNMVVEGAGFERRTIDLGDAAPEADLAGDIPSRQYQGPGQARRSAFDGPFGTTEAGDPLPVGFKPDGLTSVGGPLPRDPSYGAMPGSEAGLQFPDDLAGDVARRQIQSPDGLVQARGDGLFGVRGQGGGIELPQDVVDGLAAPGTPIAQAATAAKKPPRAGKPAPIDPTATPVASAVDRLPLGPALEDAPAVAAKGSQPVDLLDDPAIHVPDAVGVTPLQRAMAEVDPKIKQAVDLIDDSHRADAALTDAHRVKQLEAVDPQAAKGYRYATAGAKPGMPIRERWQVKGKHIASDPKRVMREPARMLTLDELANGYVNEEGILVKTTPGRIRDALAVSNPAERKAILDRLSPDMTYTVMRGKQEVSFYRPGGAVEDDLTRFGGEYRAPRPGMEIHEGEWMAQQPWWPRKGDKIDASTLAAEPVRLPVAEVAKADERMTKGAARDARLKEPVPARVNPDTTSTRPFAAGENDALPVAGAGRPVEEVIYDPALDGPMLADPAVPSVAKGSQRSAAIDPFAAQVNAAAGRVGGRKVLISDLYEDAAFDGMTLPEFKAKLVEAQKAGRVNLARVDLAGAFEPSVLAASKVSTPLGEGLDATFHAVEVEPVGALSARMEPAAIDDAFDNTDLSRAYDDAIEAKAEEFQVQPHQIEEMLSNRNSMEAMSDHQMLSVRAKQAGLDLPPEVLAAADAVEMGMADQSRRSMASIVNHAEDLPIGASADGSIMGPTERTGRGRGPAGPAPGVPEQIPVYPGDRGSMPGTRLFDPMGGGVQRNPTISEHLDDLMAERDPMDTLRSAAPEGMMRHPQEYPRVGGYGRSGELSGKAARDSILDPSPSVMHGWMPSSGKLADAILDNIPPSKARSPFDLQYGPDPVPTAPRPEAVFDRRPTAKIDARRAKKDQALIDEAQTAKSRGLADYPRPYTSPQTAEAWWRETGATPETATMLDRENFAKWEKRQGTPAAKSGLLSTLANIGTGLEVAQAVGVHTPFDPDKIPLVGPLLGAYLKLRGGMMALKRFGILTPATGHALAVERSMTVRNGIARSVDGMLAGTGKAAKATGVVGPLVAWRLHDILSKPIIPGVVADAKRAKMTEEDALTDHANEVRAMATNLDAIAAAVRRGLPPGTDPDLVAATVEAAQRKVTYLAEHAPVEPPHSLFRPIKWVVSFGEQVKYARRVRAANDPSTVWTDIANGTLTAEAIDAYKNVYPDQYEEMKAYLVAQQASLRAALGPEQIAQLSALFGAALRPGLEPENMQRMQEAGVTPPSQQSGGAPTGPGLGLPSGGPSGLAAAAQPGAYRAPAQ